MPCTLTMRRIGLPEQSVRKSLLAAGASLFSEGIQHGSGKILIVEAFRRLGGADDMRVRGETAPHGFQQGAFALQARTHRHSAGACQESGRRGRASRP